KWLPRRKGERNQIRRPKSEGRKKSETRTSKQTTCHRKLGFFVLQSHATTPRVREENLCLALIFLPRCLCLTSSEFAIRPSFGARISGFGLTLCWDRTRAPSQSCNVRPVVAGRFAPFGLAHAHRNR